jgi:beta-lactamase regulating signal transducer with metallopeptidase domain
MYFLLGLSIVLAAMLIVNSIASLGASLLWRGLERYAGNWSAASRASLLTTLRILPVSAGIASVGLLFGPAYLTHEPRTDHEDVSAKLATLAIFSVIGIGLAVVRGIVTWRVTTRFRNDWLQNAQAIRFPGINIPTYRIEHPFPVIAIVGSLRPRLFIANRVLQTLTSEELKAAINHEAGHVIHRDNLKRGLMRACRDSLLIIPCGRLLDRAWKEASEEAADEHAARGGASVALDLASSLVKIARMIPVGARPAMPAGGFLVGTDETAGVRTRVRRLMQLANDHRYPKRAAFVFRIPTSVPIVLMVLVVAALSTEPHVLAAVHSLIEDVVYLLT